jgi:hypothetical protein
MLPTQLHLFKLILNHFQVYIIKNELVLSKLVLVVKSDHVRCLAFHGQNVLFSLNLNLECQLIQVKTKIYILQDNIFFL